MEERRRRGGGRREGEEEGGDRERRRDGGRRGGGRGEGGGRREMEEEGGEERWREDERSREEREGGGRTGWEEREVRGRERREEREKRGEREKERTGGGKIGKNNAYKNKVNSIWKVTSRPTRHFNINVTRHSVLQGFRTHSHAVRICWNEVVGEHGSTSPGLLSGHVSKVTEQQNHYQGMNLYK
jgi:hypothetical protein